MYFLRLITIFIRCHFYQKYYNKISKMQSQFNLKGILKMIRKQQQVNKSLIDRESYYEEQLKMIVSDKFYYSDFKNFRKVRLFALQNHNKNTNVISHVIHNHNELLELYVLYFFINSDGKEANLSKFKNYVYRAQITLPSNYIAGSVQWDFEDNTFYRYFIAKILKVRLDFQDIQSVIQFFHDYQILMKIMVIIFRNYLFQNKAIDHDFNTPINHQHIGILNNHFQLSEHRFLFNISNKTLTNERLQNLQGLIVQNKHKYLKQKQQKEDRNQKENEKQSYKRLNEKVLILEQQYKNNKTEQIYKNTDQKQQGEKQPDIRQQLPQKKHSQQKREMEYQENYQERVSTVMNPENKEKFVEAPQDPQRKKSLSFSIKRRLSEDMKNVQSQKIIPFPTVPNIQNQRTYEKQQMKRLSQEENKFFQIPSKISTHPKQQSNRYDRQTCTACQLI